MLLLSRRPGEKIVIYAPDGQEIWLTVTEALPGRCKIGIDAPQVYKIFRQELLPRLEGDGDRRAE